MDKVGRITQLTAEVAKFKAMASCEHNDCRIQELDSLRKENAKLKAEVAELKNELDRDIYKYSHHCDQHDYSWQDNIRRAGRDECYACLTNDKNKLQSQLKAIREAASPENIEKTMSNVEDKYYPYLSKISTYTEAISKAILKGGK